MEYFAVGSAQSVIDARQADELFAALLDRLGRLRRVLLIPPDYTRLHSGVGTLAVQLYQQLVQRGTDVLVLPALGTHAPLTAAEISAMFPQLPHDTVRVHNWRADLVELASCRPSMCTQSAKVASHTRSPAR